MIIVGKRQHKSTPIRSLSIFEIEKVIGRGTFGVVFKAKETSTDRVQLTGLRGPSSAGVALKKIRMEHEQQGFPVTVSSYCR